MANQEDSKRKLVEFLWVEINRAILNSPEVKSSIKILKDLELLDHIADYNLVLDVNALIDLIQRDEKIQTLPSSKDGIEPKASPKPESGKAGEEKPKQEAPEHRIDGKKLTENEVHFQKHLERNFDESEWLKKAGIRFLN